MMGIRPGGLDHPAVAELLAYHAVEARGDIPADNAHALDIDGLRAPGITFFAAWDGEELLGIAALRSLAVDQGEVKSMRVAPAHVGKGVGRALLNHVIATARARGYRRLSLETGTAERFAPANGLYAAAGFVDGEAFGGYPPSPHNRFMTLDLTWRRPRATGTRMPTLVLIRHGQSAWNLENRFTGWWDVDLTPQGEAEARAAGELMAAKGVDIDLCFTSLQTRAIRTLYIAQAAMGRLWLPVEKHWRLNERHYGGLTGLDKAQTVAEHGEDQVKVWRRSFDTPPPAMAPGGPFDLAADRRYAGVAVPATESLKDTIARVLPYWDERIAPALRSGQRVMIAAHGNSLRALVKHLSGIADDAITGLEIPTGQPIVYELDGDLREVERYYLHER